MSKHYLRFFVVCLVFIQAGCGGIDPNLPICFLDHESDPLPVTDATPDFILGMWYNRVPGAGEAVTNTIVFRSDGTGKLGLYRPAIARPMTGEPIKPKDELHQTYPIATSNFQMTAAVHWRYEGQGVWSVKYGADTFADSPVMGSGGITGEYRRHGDTLTQTGGMLFRAGEGREPVVWLRAKVSRRE